MQLQRSYEKKMIGGVASGLADNFNIDPTWVRVGFVVFTLFGGSGIPLYLILWAVIPRSDGTGTVAEDGISKAKDWYAERNRPDE